MPPPDHLDFLGSGVMRPQQSSEGPQDSPPYREPYYGRPPRPPRHARRLAAFVALVVALAFFVPYYLMGGEGILMGLFLLIVVLFGSVFWAWTWSAVRRPR